jgi:hypothetical protein
VIFLRTKLNSYDQNESIIFLITCEYCKKKKSLHVNFVKKINKKESHYIECMKWRNEKKCEYIIKESLHAGDLFM